MDLRFTPEEQEFRQEVRSFIAANLDKETHASMVAGHRPSKEQIVAWQRILNKKGWATVDWPAEFGGTGWSIIKRHIFREEVQAHPAPEPLAFGVDMVGPVIITFGTKRRRRNFCRASLSRGLVVPGLFRARRGLGPRLAARLAARVATAIITSSTARRPGRPWRNMPTGSSASSAPIRNVKAAGRHLLPAHRHEVAGHHREPDHQCSMAADEVNEVFFDNVKVPVENRVGDENKGWTYAKFLLVERAVGHRRRRRAPRKAARGCEDRRAETRRAGAAHRGPKIRRQDRRSRDRAEGARISRELRALANEQNKGKGSRVPRPRSSRSAAPRSSSGSPSSPSRRRAITASSAKISTPRSATTRRIAPEWMRLPRRTYFNMRKVSIYGGSNEIQRNIIAKQILRTLNFGILGKPPSASTLFSGSHASWISISPMSSASCATMWSASPRGPRPRPRVRHGAASAGSNSRSLGFWPFPSPRKTAASDGARSRR